MPFIAPTDPRPVRAKVYVAGINIAQYGTEVVMRPVTRGDDNKQWSAATPSGEIKLQIANKVAADNFAPGQEWYLDMIPVPAESVGQEGMGD